MKYPLLMFLLIVFTAGCEQKNDYKYQDKALSIECSGMDAKLLKEVLFSFENDISAFYNNQNYSPASSIYYQYGYANFIFTGATGEADFKRIVSPHTVSVLQKLKEVPQLFIHNKENSNLNYTNEFVQCLIENFKNIEIRDKIKTLLKVNYLTPKNMAELYRVNIKDAQSDRYFALFIALETYYQYLVDLDLSNQQTNG